MAYNVSTSDWGHRMMQDQLSDVFPTFPIPLPSEFDENSLSVAVTVKSGPVCPLGFICNKTHQAECAEIQSVAVNEFKFGDIHGGAWCPLGSPYYLNCPIGYYCPNPSTKIICPSGMFCPHKTNAPSIPCERCPEGAVELWRGTFGVALLCIFSIAVLGYLASIFFRTRFAAIQEKLEKMSNKILTKFEMERQEKERQKRLERIRPQLDIIHQRLNGGHMSAVGGGEEEGMNFMLSQSNTSANSHATNPLHLSSKGQVILDAAELFDSIDTNGDGVLSYKELNTILHLEELELNDFIRRMNSLSPYADTDQQSVSKEIFVQYFLEALEETSNFRLTAEEAGVQWDEIFATHGATSKGEVPFDALYRSSLGHFLTDVQIRDVILELRKANQIEAALIRTPVSTRSNNFRGGSGFSTGVTRAVFCNYYPGILQDILADQSHRSESRRKDGIDIAFENLKLVVKVGRDSSVNVVDDVSGRIQKGTMTALLGGSGAGKTSLLNALCGRAYYGEVQGDVYINGKKAAVEAFADSIGFVPQDDIVFAELTVRENLLFSGRFRLPRGTPLRNIEDLAEAVLVNLGLSRKANSIVGDVTRRGVSGGEKKRVNIGLELMAKPSALFLDEPTSGLDASSALLVMMSLKQLVEKQGVTICSVIHQPRKFIFDLFDSVLLLGVGGRMVYHGPVDESLTYFASLGYQLPTGESVADWLIDISTGRVAVDDPVRSDNVWEKPEEPDEENARPLRRKPSTGLSTRGFSGPSRFDETSEAISSNSENRKTDGYASFREPTRKDSQIVTSAGPSSNKAERADIEAKLRRELLFENWKHHFKCLDLDGKKRYEPPQPYAFPVKTIMPTFWTQFLLQMKRMFLLAWRNRVTKTIETAVIVFAVTIMTFFAGPTTLSTNGQTGIPLIPFEAFIAGNPAVIEQFFRPLFEFSISAGPQLVRYGLSVGLVASVLIALTSVKAITEKRLEFFREAGSGYDSNAYLLAVNVCTTIEQGSQILFAAIIAQWTRHSISSVAIFYLSFLLLCWISVSWSLLIALLIPPKNTMVILGFFMAFFGLLFGGALPPGSYEQIYKNPAMALFCAFFSSPRYFTETLVVSDMKCLPAQTGFTVGTDATNFPEGKSSFDFLFWAMTDSSVTNPSCNGWYWNVLPAVMVGITLRFVSFGVINSFGLQQQAKKSFWFQMRYQGSRELYVRVAIYCVCLVALFVTTCVLILRQS